MSPWACTSVSVGRPVWGSVVKVSLVVGKACCTIRDVRARLVMGAVDAVDGEDTATEDGL